MFSTFFWVSHKLLFHSHFTPEFVWLISESVHPALCRFSLDNPLVKELTEVGLRWCVNAPGNNAEHPPWASGRRDDVVHVEQTSYSSLLAIVSSVQFVALRFAHELSLSLFLNKSLKTIKKEWVKEYYYLFQIKGNKSELRGNKNRLIWPFGICSLHKMPVQKKTKTQLPVDFCLHGEINKAILKKTV